MPLPPYLYRGDSDPFGKRKLRQFYPGSASAGMRSNLADGGQGSEIFQAPLAQTIARHVEPGWTQTHYLSFSTRRDVALRFAAGHSEASLQTGNPTRWDSLLATISTSRFETQEELQSGIYLCRYQTTQGQKHADLPLPEVLIRALTKQWRQVATVLLLDVVTVLRSHDSISYTEAIRNAERDSEWLVLPADSPASIPGELSAVLDDGCIEQVEFLVSAP